MRVGIFYHHNRTGSALACCRAFAAGLARHAVDSFLVPREESNRPCDVAVCWGLRSLAMLPPRPCILLENGFVNRDDDEPYRAVGLNGLGGRADFGNRDMPPDRWRQLNVTLAPWRTDGEFVLVCGQVLHDRSHADRVDIRKWYAETIDGLVRRQSRPVEFRPHPRCPHNDEVAAELPVRRSRNTLSEDLDRAHCLVTFNSTCGVDAIVRGVPVVSCDQGSMVSSVSSHRLEDVAAPPQPDRRQWAADLAYAQWRDAEIARGATWEHLRGRVEAALQSVETDSSCHVD